MCYNNKLYNDLYDLIIDQVSLVYNGNLLREDRKNKYEKVLIPLYKCILFDSSTLINAYKKNSSILEKEKIEKSKEIPLIFDSDNINGILNKFELITDKDDKITKILELIRNNDIFNVDISQNASYNFFNQIFNEIKLNINKYTLELKELNDKFSNDDNIHFELFKYFDELIENNSNRGYDQELEMRGFRFDNSKEEFLINLKIIFLIIFLFDPLNYFIYEIIAFINKNIIDNFEFNNQKIKELIKLYFLFIISYTNIPNVDKQRFTEFYNSLIINPNVTDDQIDKLVISMKDVEFKEKFKELFKDIRFIFNNLKDDKKFKDILIIIKKIFIIIINNFLMIIKINKDDFKDILERSASKMDIYEKFKKYLEENSKSSNIQKISSDLLLILNLMDTMPVKNNSQSRLSFLKISMPNISGFFKRGTTNNLIGGNNNNEFINYEYKGKVYKRKIRYDDKNRIYIIINKKEIYLINKNKRRNK